MRDALNGNPVNNNRVGLSVRMWIWSRENKLPQDFLDYPASVVDEVFHLQNLEGEISDEISSRQEREKELKAKGMI